MRDDLVTELEDFAAVVDGCNGKALVTMVSGELFLDAAAEIRYLRGIVSLVRDMLGTGFPKTAQQMCFDAMFNSAHSWRTSDDRPD